MILMNKTKLIDIWGKAWPSLLSTAGALAVSLLILSINNIRASADKREILINTCLWTNEELEQNIEWLSINIQGFKKNVKEYGPMQYNAGINHIGTVAFEKLVVQLKPGEYLDINEYRVLVNTLAAIKYMEKSLDDRQGLRNALIGGQAKNTLLMKCDEEIIGNMEKMVINISTARMIIVNRLLK